MHRIIRAIRYRKCPICGSKMAPNCTNNNCPNGM